MSTSSFFLEEGQDEGLNGEGQGHSSSCICFTKAQTPHPVESRFDRSFPTPP